MGSSCPILVDIAMRTAGDYLGISTWSRASLGSNRDSAEGSRGADNQRFQELAEDCTADSARYAETRRLQSA